MKINSIYFMIFILIFLFCFTAVYSQSEGITLKLSRDFGYSSGTGNIQGLFSMKVTSSEQIIQVVFFMDSVPIGKDEDEPFNLQFRTDDYSTGEHTLYAIGHAIDGIELKTNDIKTIFISAEESKKAAQTLVVPILGLSLIVVIGTSLIPALFSKKKSAVKPGSQRTYGIAGGTICPRCSRPFSRHILSPNLIAGKLECCPHCGKWGIFRTYSMDLLRKAEESELNTALDQNTPKLPKDDEDRLRIELDKTKYDGV